MVPKKKWDWKDEEFLRAIGDLIIAGYSMTLVQQELSKTYEDLPPAETFTSRIRQTSTTPEDFRRALGETRYKIVEREFAARGRKKIEPGEDDPLRLRPYKKPTSS